jgi:hypothetical protein
VRRAVEGAKQAAVAPLTREDARCSRRGTRLSRYQGFKAVVLDHLPCPQGPSLPYLYTPHNSACASLRFTRLQHEALRPHFYHPEISATGRTRLLVAMLVGKFQLWSGGLESKKESEMLRMADNVTGYFGVYLDHPGQPKPYVAQVSRGGQVVHLGSFATAEEAALCFARSPEGQAAARWAAAAPLTSEDALQLQARDETIKAVTLDIIYQAGAAATIELSAEVAAEVMAGIAMGLPLPPVPPGSLDHGQDSMAPGQRALHVARQCMQIARTDVELHQAIHTLAVALGAYRTEEGTIKALHAVLLQMDRPGMSETEACTSKGASLTNFRKWKRRVQQVQHRYLGPRPIFQNGP